MPKRVIGFALTVLLLIGSVFPSLGLETISAADDRPGTTYYVSTLSGSDHNDGKSQSEAFYSLDKINELELGPGDKVLLEAGSVFADGYLHIKGSGAEGAPIIIDRYGEGNDPEIQTNGEGIWYQDYGKVLDNPSHKNKGYVSSSILLYDVEYIEISNLNISNAPDFDEPYSDVDKMNRTGVAAVAQNKGTINHIHLKSLNIHDIRGNVYDKHMNNGGIYFTVFNPLNEAETGIARYNDVLIEDNIVNDVSRWGIAVGYTAYSNHFLAKEISDETIAKYGSGDVVIRNNYIKDPGGDAITAMYLDRPLIEYNVSEGAAKEINEEIYSETSFGRVAAGIWPWKSKDPVFQYNEVFDMHFNQDGQAWDADYGDGAIYQYNYSHNNGGGALMVCLWDAVNTTFRYNISQNDLSGVLSLPSNPDAHIYNNVFYIKEGVDLIRPSMSNGTAVIENNIIYNAGEEEKEEDWTKELNVSYSNNLYYNYKNTPESDENAVIGDPLFVDAGSAPTTKNIVDKSVVAYERDAFGGYKLQANSPAINKGKYIANNGGFDFFGNPIGLIPDIGIHEADGDEDVNVIYVDNYKTNKNKIFDIPKDTKVSEFKKNIVKSTSTTLMIKDSDGNELTNSDKVLNDAKLIVTFKDNSKEEYVLELMKEYKEYEVKNATAGSEQSGEGADLAIDGDVNTIWHTAWAGTDQENVWISLDLGEVKPVEMLKYVPRQAGGKNGMFTEYSIYVKESESADWTKIETYENEWPVSTATKFAYFDQVNARFIKLQADNSFSDQAVIFGSAAEVTVGIEAKGEED